MHENVSVSTLERMFLKEREHDNFMKKFTENIHSLDAEIIDIDGLRVEYKDSWGLVRPSNTSPYIIFRFEADVELELERIQAEFRKIINLIKSGIEEGATLAAGGPVLPNGLNKGYFIKPTIFTNVTNDMQIAKKEIFGPVLSIISFETEEEAIKITNDTEYGLGNYLQTEDKEKAKRVAKKLRSGIVYINGKAADSGTPFGGYRQSGNGREGLSLIHI